MENYGNLDFGKSEYLSLRDTSTNLGYEGSSAGPESRRYANLRPLGMSYED